MINAYIYRSRIHIGLQFLNKELGNFPYNAYLGQHSKTPMGRPTTLSPWSQPIRPTHNHLLKDKVRITKNPEEDTNLGPEGSFFFNNTASFTTSKALAKKL